MATIDRAAVRAALAGARIDPVDLAYSLVRALDARPDSCAGDLTGTAAILATAPGLSSAGPLLAALQAAGVRCDCALLGALAGE